MRGQRAVALLLCAASLWALLVTAAPNALAEDREQALRHLKVGVTLFNERNYEAAQVEFEASYRDLPSASALQNIALCQTKRFHYVDAIETLETLKQRFGAGLSAQEARQVEDALRNLSQLVATVTFQVKPPSSLVTIDGKPLTADELARPIRLSSGEYRVDATAPNHVPVRRIVKVAGGESKSVSIELQPAVGRLSVQVNDETASIALDRVPLAYGTWTGDVPAGEHMLQIYKPGHVTVSTRITVRTGDRMELRLPVGPAATGDTQPPAYDLVGLPYRHGKRIRSPLEPDVGWFGLVSASNLAVLRSPDGFEADDDADATGGSFGLRGGYRFGEYLALEGMFDTGSQSVSGTLEDAPETYDLTTRRYGGNVRVLLGGKSVRFSGTFGVGAVWHRLELAGRTYSGTNSYFGLELGPQFTVGHVLLEGVAQAFFEGANNTKDGDARIYTDRTVLPQVGIGLRVGFCQWGTW